MTESPRIWRHLDLFSGIGGFALAARWMGWQTVAFCEIDPFCQTVLRKHWPDVPIHPDVRTLEHDGAVDILTAGIPCQPASCAGKRKGSADERWLWPAAFDVVRRVRPTWVVLENVPGFIGLQPLGLDWACGELEDAGYLVAPVVLGADDVGAPHRRKRVWIIGRLADANSGGEPQSGLLGAGVLAEPGARELADPASIGRESAITPTDSATCRTTPGSRQLADAASAQDNEEPHRPTDHEGGRLTDVPCGCGAYRTEAQLADAYAGRRRQDCLPSELRAGGPVEPSRHRRTRSAGEGAEVTSQGRDCGVVPMADAESLRHWLNENGEREPDKGWAAPGASVQEPADGHSAVVGSVEPGVLRESDGLPCGLDGRWPARPGEAQHGWEPPRTGHNIPQCSARLKALGNAIVPQCAYVILKAIQETEEHPDA